MQKRTNPKKVLRDFEKVLGIRRQRLQVDESTAHRRDVFDTIGQWNLKFTDLLIVSQLRHRFALGDPVAPMIEATQDAERLAALWKKGSKLQDRTSPNPKPHTESGWIWERLPLRVDVIEFRFGIAAVLSLLVYDEMSPAILDVVPKMSDWTDAEEGFNYLNFPDAGLVEILRKGKRPPKWRAMLQYATHTFGRSLLEESFECYADIIIATRRGNWAAALDSVVRSHELYEQRAADIEYEEFEPWEGIGAGNALSIDLRLSALMRYCFRENPQPLDELNSIHRWKS